MNYVFLTGATGLLGRYLIKDLTLAGIPVAVLVRPSRRATAQHRVENVMCFWDKELGRSLPRPVVLEGDITEPDLGLDARSTRWVAENCDTMLHNAASLTFLSTGPNSEPWRSNLSGTRHVLELCRNARIRNFHHVSTAYVAGLRSGRILETDLDVGQKLSNDYEQSKLQAEKIVRAADCIETLTVHRPAIIIGDSQTGYTSTYHGFYALLQAIATLAQQFTADPTGHFAVEGHFGVSGRETKNLVPVDWVSAVMSHIITHPEHHGKTYHLTPMHPVPSRLLADIFEEAIGFYGVKFEGAGQPLSGLTEYEQLFCELISVYNSYWKDDPTFDCTNTRNAAPHLPCPHIDRQLLLRMCEYAMRVKFTSPRAKAVEPAFDVAASLEQLVETGSDNSAGVSPQAVGLRVTGHGGGDWTILLANGEVVSADLGISSRASITFECEVDTYAALVAGSLQADRAFAEGKLQIAGNSQLRSLLGRMIPQLSEAHQSRAMASN
ncbi:MAG: SDR family oxidoreductase [Planctomycetes bacterium]|nr:SDR family oxidoreductase [Planctomycetota bacterium]